LLTRLVSINIIVIQLLIKELESGRMNLNDFKTHIRFKLKFLKEHEHGINQSTLKFSIAKTIKVCDEILEQGNKVMT
jgi:hypothetical protein